MSADRAPVRPSATVAAVPRAGLALFLLYLLNALLVLDKIVFTVLLEPIKAEFKLDDFRLGLLAGAVYAVCLGIASLPFGILADRSNRRNIAAGCLAAWSAMTALCGLAQSFTTLLLARLGVGIGEAGGGPASLSIIADLYEHRRRATAMAIFSLGTPTAALINLSINTQIAHAWGWRGALLAASIPGFLVALAIFFLMPEPPRTVREEKPRSSLRAVGRHIAATPSLALLLAGAMCAYVVLAGVSSWNFSFLIRTHHVKLNEVGPLLGVAIAGAGIVGLYASGRLADLLADRDERWRTRVMAITVCGSVLCGWGAFNVADWHWAVAFTAGLAACASLWLAPGFALSQSLVPSDMRGTIGAIMFMLANVVGYGLGPPLVGALSDGFAGSAGPDALRLALSIAVTGNLVSAALFLFAGRTLRRDLTANLA